MRLCYLLLSPTWGMHQYTACVANDMARAGHDVHLVTTGRAPLDRYSPAVTCHTPVSTRNSGFSLDALRPAALRAALRTLQDLRPDLVHVTGVHLWNPFLLGPLRRAGVPTVHDLHDLHPHAGAVYGRLLYLWNGWVRRLADHLLVHGALFRDELLAFGVPPGRVTCTLLTFRTFSYELEQAFIQPPPDLRYEPWALFIGRLETYKGLAVLAAAAQQIEPHGLRVVIGGPGNLQALVPGSLPANVEVRNRFVVDQEAADLLRRCGLMVLPYTQASNSGLVATAYSFCKPVIVTRAGALPEYVVDGQTGWVIPPGDPAALARALHDALADPSRLAAMGLAARAWYDRHRRLETEALSRLYHRLARPTPHQAPS